MIYLNIKTSDLRRPEMIGSDPVVRATWLFLMAHCVEQENGGILLGCGNWRDRQWQQTCGVTLEEVRSDSDLWYWDEGSLFLLFYPEECAVRCSKCGVACQESEFYFKDRSSGKRSSTCKSCLNENSRIRYVEDPEYAIKCRLRARLRAALQVKDYEKLAGYDELIGCSPLDLALHIESKFADDMAWSNMGEWHIDHIRPLSSFDLSTREGQLAASHYTNLQPLWAADNLSKGAKTQ